MGDQPSQPCAEFNVGTTVTARYNSSSKSYHPATIIKKHDGHLLGRYDVKFLPNGPIHTVFADDIRYKKDRSHPHNTQKKNNIHDENALNPKIFQFELTNNTTSETTRICHELNVAMKQKKPIRVNLTEKPHSNTGKRKSLSPEKFKQIETVILKVGGNSFYQEIISSERENVNKQIIESIKTAAVSNENIKYIQHLKSIESTNNSSTMDYTITMDLDYDKTVTNNHNFTSEINEEIASILHIDPSFIEIKSIQKGSVQITIAIVIAVVVLSLLCGLLFPEAYNKYKKCVSATCTKKVFKHVESGVEFPDEYNPGDEVIVEYKARKYPAVVLEKRMDINGLWIKVEYSDHPFLFKNTEEIRADSGRLQFLEPGARYESFCIASDENSLYIEASPSV